MKTKFELIRWLKNDFNHRQYVIDSKTKQDYIFELYRAIYEEVKEEMKEEIFDKLEEEYDSGYNDGYASGYETGKAMKDE